MSSAQNAVSIASFKGFDAYYNDWGNGTAVSGWIILPPSVQVDLIDMEARLSGVPIGTTHVTDGMKQRHVRFSIKCEKSFRPIDILTNRLTVHARTRHIVEEVTLRADPGLIGWMAKVAFNENIFQHIRTPEAAKFVLEALEGRFGPSLLSERGVEAPAALPVDAQRDVTPLLHRTGTISQDRSAILGREGIIFLYEGTNRLYSQYQETELTKANRDLAVKWATIIENRIAYFKSRKIAFAQTIIPEKASVIPELFPSSILTPTRLFAAVEEAAEAKPDRYGISYVPMLAPLRQAPNASRLYQKTDSHFSTEGAIAGTRILLQSLALQNEKICNAMPEVEEIMARASAARRPPILVVGDLASRFFGVPLYEEHTDIRYETLFNGPDRVNQIEFHKPADGNLTNTRLVWRHPAAPLDISLIAFGNSFFERGSACNGLAWWFKHLCREFHMVWTRDIKPDYIEGVKPDAVICQTIERFLTVVPEI